MDNYTLCTAKEFNRITEEKLCGNGNFVTLLDGKSINNTKLYSSCNITFEEVISNMSEISGVSLGGYNPSKEDALIMNGIFTIIEGRGGFENSKFISFTTRELIKVIKRDPQYEPGYEEVQKISKIIYALSSTWLSIELIDNRKNKKLSYKRRAPLLHIEAEELYLDNILIVNRWELVAVPILYEYSSLDGLNRLRSIDASYYPKLRMRKEDLNLVIMDYIALRIENFRKGYLKSNKIMYSYIDHGKLKGLLPHCGIFEENYADNKSFRNKKAKIHKSICELLDSHIKSDLISGYEVIKSGNRIDGFTIKL